MSFKTNSDRSFPFYLTCFAKALFLPPTGKNLRKICFFTSDEKRNSVE